jgi:acetyltransferase-like isoleucine patch superfamily enzyme
MDIRGLILVPPADKAQNKGLPCSPALLDVVGRTPAERMASRMKQSGISAVSVIHAAESSQVPAGVVSGIEYQPVDPRSFWPSAEAVFTHMGNSGAELVLVCALNTYSEIHFEKLIQFHLDHRALITQACCVSQPVQVFCISPSRRAGAESLFRSHLSGQPQYAIFTGQGYATSLVTAQDLRRLAIDILTLRTETQPAFAQLRPGVWVGPGALIEKDARLLAPSFVGAFATVRAGAVVTRCSSVEQHAEVDCGTILENSTLLPGVRIGAGLDLSHAVAGPRSIVSLRRNAMVEIADPRLIGHASPLSWTRRLRAAGAAVDFRGAIRQRLFRRRLEEMAAPEPAPAPARAVNLEIEPAAELSPGLMVVRRS